MAGTLAELEEDYDPEGSNQQKEVDAFFEDSNVPDAPSDDLFRVMEKFVRDYSSKLAEIREALSDSMSEAWEPENEVIRVLMTPRDRTPLLSLFKTENTQFNKVCTVFAVLMEEIRFLVSTAEQKFYGPLTMFGHQVEEPPPAPGEPGFGEKKDTRPSPPPQENLEQEMGQLVPFLQDLVNFLARAYAVGQNMVAQIACLYHERQKLYVSTFKHVDLTCVFEALGQLLRVLITLDAIILDNPAIADGWGAYKRMVKYIRADPERYGIEAGKLRTFEGLLLQLDRKILSGHIFDGFLQQKFGLAANISSKALVEGNRVLYALFNNTIKALLQRLVTGFQEQVETYPRETVVDLFGLYALSRAIFVQTQKPDSSLYKYMWALQKKVPLVLLWGRAIWLPADFLQTHAPLKVSSLDPSPKAVEKERAKQLAEMDDKMSKQGQELYLHLAMWMVRIESELSLPKPNRQPQAADGSTEKAARTRAEIMLARAKLILNGLLLANQIRNLVTINIHMHLLLQKPFRAGNLRTLAMCAEMLKAVEMTYKRRINMIGVYLTQLLEQTARALLYILRPLLAKLDRKPRLDDGQLDVLAALKLAMELLTKAHTPARNTALQLAMSVVSMKGMLEMKYYSQIRYGMWKLELLSNWQERMTSTCQCSFLYWITNLVPEFFRDIYADPTQVNRLQYIFHAFRDSMPLLQHASHADPGRMMRAFKHEVLTHFEETILTPLCREVETDLRLHIHSVVLQQESLRVTNIKDISKLLDLKPLSFFDQVISVKDRVTHYLDGVFYNLTSVTLHDWRVYAEMRNLASEKYGLQMTEAHLPGSSHYSEALDVLEIMRNIHIFVARYNYNMNNQIFLERAFDQKHINSINIHHIADSIRTHGTGIMNTTVNYTYQFLVRKFAIFSEFLYDDHIKSRLLKAIRWFQKEKDNLSNRYPHERADKFNRDIRKLGVTEAGATFVDQFRQQITEIGNALGYVRMVRSGGLHHTSNAIKFVPDLEMMGAFAEDAREEKLSEETLGAAEKLDQVLSEMEGSFSEGTNYFQVLVNIFKDVFKSDEHIHLNNFYIIVPPLTLSFVDKMIAQKAQLSKKGSRTEATFSDDGFALGLAYILKLLGQDEEFDGLHWFESVALHLEKKLQEAEQLKAQTLKKKPAKKTEDEAASSQRFTSIEQALMTEKRLRATQMEFELLFYSFTGARICFRENLNARQEAERNAEAAKETASSNTGAAGPEPEGPPVAPDVNVTAVTAADMAPLPSFT